MQEVSPAVRGMFDEALKHHRSGRLGEAERLYRQILALDYGHSDSLQLLGIVAQQTGRQEMAIDLLRQAIAIDSATATYHSNLANILWEQGRPDEAVVSCYRALDLQPNFPEAHNNLGNALKALGTLDEASACYLKAINLRYDYPEAHFNLGHTLEKQGHVVEAIASYRTAIDIKPDYVGVYLNLGNALREQGKLDEAVACYQKAIEFEPDYSEAHGNLAIALLAQGNMAVGWEEYEWRWKTADMIESRRDFSQPQWRGEAAEGKTLLIHAEQGFGDTLQFCRYAPLAATRGLRIIMEVQKPLIRLLRSMQGIDWLIGDDEELPPFDLQCPMLSLPLALRTTLTTIPGSASYLKADAAQCVVWRKRLASRACQGPRIGLVWAGNPRTHLSTAAAIDQRRSMPPERLAPLFEVPAIQFFSLQKDGPVAPTNFPLTDFMDEMEDFADTAALIANFDLVISVDTAVAHLAAALGKPVWVMDRFDHCWRWLVGRRDSPWYPTLRLYRQPKPGDWDSVVVEIVRDLHNFIRPPPVL